MKHFKLEKEVDKFADRLAVNGVTDAFILVGMDDGSYVMKRLRNPNTKNTDVAKAISIIWDEITNVSEDVEGS